MGGLLLLTVALLLAGSCEGRPLERSLGHLKAGGQEADPPVAMDPPTHELEAGGLEANQLEVEGPSVSALAHNVQHEELIEAHDVHEAVEGRAAHSPGAVKARKPRYFPLGLPGAGVGGGIGGGGYQRLFGLYPSLFGGTYYSIFGGVSQGGPFPYPPVPIYR